MIIGITGSIGSGKTAVAKIFSQKGFFYIDADDVVNELYQPGQNGWRKIKSFFGAEYLDENQNVDRKRLRQLVFQHPQKLKILNRIIHPLVTHEIERLIARTDNPNICIEAIDFNPKQLGRLIDKLILVKAPADQIITRIAKTRGLSPKEIHAILKNQPMPVDADFTIHNKGTLSDLKKQVEAILSSKRIM